MSTNREEMEKEETIASQQEEKVESEKINLTFSFQEKKNEMQF